MNGPLHIKIVMTGDCGVSKTSIMNQLKRDKSKRYISELEIEARVKDRDVKLEVWDTCGE